jgi:hypothetical protein
MGSDDARTAIEQAVARWPDNARTKLLEAIDAIEAVEPGCEEAALFSDADLDRAMAAADVVRRGGPDAERVGRYDLAALSPDAAGQLVSDLVKDGRMDAVTWVVAGVPPQRLPAGVLLRATGSMAIGGPERTAIVHALAVMPRIRLLRGFAEAPDADLAAEVAAARAEAAAGPPYVWGYGPPRASAEPPAPSMPEAPPMESPADEPVFRGPDDEKARQAYARLDVASGTERPDVVVLDQPFEVTVGLQGRRDRDLVASAPVAFAAGETVDLEVVLLYDPASLELTGSPRTTLTVSDLQPFPSVTFTCTAKYGDELAQQRRIGFQLLREHRVVAVAWRTIVAVDSAADVATAPAVPRRDVTLLDLDPLLGEEPPDLVVSVSRADAASNTFVWTAYAADPAVSVPDLPSGSTLDGDVAGFATETRRAIQFSADPAKDYLGLAGRARRIARAVPEGLQDAIRAVVEAPGRTNAPAVLLLTEELTVPWELAAFDPPLTSTWGAASPFLGAHAAISRWPLTEHKPRPAPRSTVSVRQGAVLTADYTGVSGWGRLDSAVTEAAEVAALFDPPATPVKPEIWAVMDLFRGAPAGDVVHVALHGQYDAQGDQEGIVLLAPSPAGGATAQFLTPAELENGRLDQGPFVFLNACQVGTDERVLGDYGGFASTLLRIGATGVVAPLWNVRDDVAATFAKTFYATTLTAAEPVSVAEAVRALRATYTEEGVRSGVPGLHATLIAYQVFGHPRLRLTRTPPAPA